MTKRISFFARETTLFWMLLGGIVCLGSMYSFLVQQTVMQVVSRGEVEKQVAMLRAETTTLESRYIALSNTITSDLAHSLGYKEISPLVIQRQSLSLAVRTHAIQ